MNRPHSGAARSLVVAAAFCAGASGAAMAQTGTQATRGELLYTTHCIACHTTQVHWRERKLARDWPSLRQQVRRWAGNAGLGWSDDEIVDVARYLNAVYYRFEIATLTGSVPRAPGSRTARAD